MEIKVVSNSEANEEYQREWEAENLIPYLRDGIKIMRGIDTDEARKWLTWAEKFLRDWERG